MIGSGAFAQVSTSPTPAAERFNGIRQRQDMIKNSLLSKIQFHNIGPSVMGGRAVDLAVNPADPTEFFVAYATGGLWYTHNNGQSFTPLFDTLPVITIGAIAVDWPDSTIWVGTGEANSSRSSYAGIGVYKSMNWGHSWQYLGLPESQHIGKILLDPLDPLTAWVAVIGHLYSPNTQRGVYKTSDGGISWRKVLYIDDQTGAIDLAMDPAYPDTLYASMWHRQRSAWDFIPSGPTSGIYKSMDGGATWSLLSHPGSGFPTGKGVGRIGLAVFPGNPELVYAVLDNNFHRPVTPADSSKYQVGDFRDMDTSRFARLNNRKLNAFLRKNGFPDKYTADSVKAMVRDGSIKPRALSEYLDNAESDLYETPVIGAQVYLSLNGGITWKKNNLHDLDLYASYGYYFGKIWVSPKNPGKLVLAGISLLMSRDSGRTFRDIDAENIHGDHHALWFDPVRDSHFIDANDGGLNITYDNGLHWFKCNTPPVGQFYSVTTDNAKPYNIYGGLQDNGVWWGPSDNVESPAWYQNGNYPFKSLNGGDGMQVQVDTRDNNTVYSGFQFGYYARNYRNNPTDYKSIHPMAALGNKNYRWNWQTPILLSSHNQDILYMGSDCFHRSMDRGDSMITLSGDLTNGKSDSQGNVPYGTITTIAESPLQFGLLYIGTDDGNIQVSEDDGYTWKKIISALPHQLWVSRVIASSFQVNRVYASLNGYRYDNFQPYLFMSEDRGAHWKSISAGLPEGPVNVIREDPQDGNMLYVGTDNGLYVSADRGKTYMAMMGGLPSVPVHDIAIQARDSQIVLGTHGRSIYIASLREVRNLPHLLGKAVVILDLNPPPYAKDWGKKKNGYLQNPSMTIPYFVSRQGLVILQICSAKGKLLHQQEDTAVAGFNFIHYNLSADSTVSGIRRAGTADIPFYHMHYLSPGLYTIELVTALGLKTEKSFTLKKQVGHSHHNGTEQEPAESL